VSLYQFLFLRRSRNKSTNYFCTSHTKFLQPCVPKSNFTEQFFTPFLAPKLFRMFTETFQVTEVTLFLTVHFLIRHSFSFVFNVLFKEFSSVETAHCHCARILANKNTSIFRYKSFPELSPVSFFCFL
jgi:hypothetical protein